jgi:Rad3-related DNA helicase
MPYNYLLDDKYREGAKIDLKNCIIIIDEAHNIKGFAEECSNFSITTEQLKSCLKEL